MHSLRRIFVTAVALVLSTGAYTATSAGAAHAETTAEVQVFKGANVLADFLVQSDCTFTEVLVFATEQLFKQGGGPLQGTPQATLIVNSFDTCAGTPIYFTYATTFESLQFKMSNVSSATVIGTVNAVNEYTGESQLVTVSLRLNGVGDVQQGESHFNVNFPGGRTVYHGNGFFRAATATGFVGTGTTNWIAGVTGSGTLNRSTEGAVQIFRS